MLLLRLALQLDTASVDRIVRAELESMRAPGGAVAIVTDGKLAYAKGYGVRSVESAEPITASTLFRIGSTTKMFTGATALRLVAERKLDLDCPIGRYARGLTPPMARLTMRDLLGHTAGLINEAAGDGAHDDSAVARRMRSWGAEHVFAPAGDVYSYSGPGYWLAGYVLSEIEKRPYADVVEARVLRPAGMTRSTFRPLVALTWPLALDHRVGPNGATVVRPFPDDVTTWPSGSLFSSAEELARFATYLLADSTLSLGMARPLSREADGVCGYSAGLSVCERHGVTTLSHAGFRGGTGSIVTMVPSRGVAVIVLSNRNGGIPFRTSRTLLAHLVPALAADTLPDADVAPATPPATPRDVTGAYVAGSDTLRVARTPNGFSYRYGADTNPARLDSARGALIVLDSAGAEVQRFSFVRGKRSGAWYLHDGLNAFRGTTVRP